MPPVKKEAAAATAAAGKKPKLAVKSAKADAGAPASQRGGKAVKKSGETPRNSQRGERKRSEAPAMNPIAAIKEDPAENSSTADERLWSAIAERDEAMARAAAAEARAAEAEARVKELEVALAAAQKAVHLNVAVGPPASTSATVVSGLVGDVVGSTIARQTAPAGGGGDGGGAKQPPAPPGALNALERMELELLRHAAIVVQKVERGHMQRSRLEAQGKSFTKTRPAIGAKPAPALERQPISAVSALPIGEREGGGGMATPRQATEGQIKAATTIERIQRGHSKRMALGKSRGLRAEAGGGAATPRQAPADAAGAEGVDDARLAKEAASDEEVQRRRVQAATRIEAAQRRKHAYNLVGSTRVPKIAIAPGAGAAGGSAEAAGPYRVNIQLSMDGTDADDLRVRLELFPSKEATAAAP